MLPEAPQDQIINLQVRYVADDGEDLAAAVHGLIDMLNEQEGVEEAEHLENVIVAVSIEDNGQLKLEGPFANQDEAIGSTDGIAVGVQAIQY